jgi:hypothetical protein
MFGASIGLLLLIALIAGVGWWVPAATADAQPADGPPRRVSLLTEAVGYIGAILVLAGGIAALGQNWRDIADGTRLAMLGVAVVVFFAAGWLTKTSTEPAFRRLSAITWAISVAAFAGGAAVLNHMADTAGKTIFLTVTTSATAYAVALWWLSRHAVQQLVMFGGVLLSASAVINFVVDSPTSGIFGITLWIIAVGWALAGWSRRLEPWWAAVALGMAVALIAPSAIGLTWALFTLGIGTAAVVMAVAVYARFTPALAFGAIAMLGYVTGAVAYYLGDRLGLPSALALTGLLVLAAAVGVARALPRIRRKPPTEHPRFPMSPPRHRHA